MSQAVKCSISSAMEKLYELGLKAAMLRIYDVITEEQYNVINNIVKDTIEKIVKEKLKEAKRDEKE